MTTIYQTIQNLIKTAIDRQLITEMDEVYVRNQLLSLLQLNDFPYSEDIQSEVVTIDTELVIPQLVDKMVQYAVSHEVIDDYFDAKEIFSAKVMNCFIARPSIVNHTFFEKFQESPKEATDYFYSLSKNSNYIQMARIKKNIQYKVSTEYGQLDITINLSKPEKDPKQIAKERDLPKVAGYPTCLLCIENEGYAGRIGHPARSNHRMIRLNLENETWYLQYSPYVYYNEHCIVLSEIHRNMEISRETFRRLLGFVEMFPHYFLGSNADLPIVGGSILSHDHYQGGNYEFAMAVAQDDYTFSIDKFPNVSCSIVKWPMSVIRLRGSKKEDLVDLSSLILDKWRSYSDEKVDILSHTGSTPHNTITPIARIRDGHYELDLVLRNNRTSEEHPLGIFHPHSDVHHIKKENIGLIEVMGLAVLPARLVDELHEVEKYILNQPNELASYHSSWAEALRKQYLTIANEKNVEEIIRKEVGLKFLRVLLDAGVFKRDEQGKAAFRTFIHHLNEF